MTGSNQSDVLNGDAGNDTLDGGYDWASADTDTLNGCCFRFHLRRKPKIGG
ncbi:MAG: hypothetical protein ACNYPE_11965 [Candidatus Azotimanducaceae bacterium WSBS_2022_MAG_OTU7]